MEWVGWDGPQYFPRVGAYANGRYLVIDYWSNLLFPIAHRTSTNFRGSRRNRPTHLHTSPLHSKMEYHNFDFNYFTGDDLATSYKIIICCIFLENWTHELNRWILFWEVVVSGGKLTIKNVTTMAIFTSMMFALSLIQITHNVGYSS